MKQLPKIFGVALFILAYGLSKDFGWADFAAWTAVISALAIGLGWLLSIVKDRLKMLGDSNEK